LLSGTNHILRIMRRTRRVAVVTGANKGIGRAIAESLCRKDFHVILTARNPALGTAALNELHAQGLKNVEFHPLDITDTKSTADFRAFVQQKHQGLDVLVNNAGIAWKGDAFDGSVAEGTLNTNYFATIAFSKLLLPLVAEGGRVVNVSSSVGLPSRLREDVRAKFVSPQLTLEQLDGLMKQFIEDVKNGTWKEKGWPKTTYGVSKIGLTAATRVLAREEKRTDVLINACHPGYVDTDMSSHKGPLTPAQGAEAPVALATLPAGSPTGGFMSEKKEWLDWPSL